MRSEVVSEPAVVQVDFAAVTGLETELRVRSPGLVTGQPPPCNGSVTEPMLLRVRKNPDDSLPLTPAKCLSSLRVCQKTP